MKLKIVCYLAILLFGNTFLASQVVWSDIGETGMDNISLNSLSEKDRKIIEMGEIKWGRYVLGGIVGTYPIGMGLGHVIQGRYRSRGWIFTVGELSSSFIIVVSAFSCLHGCLDSSGPGLVRNIGLASYLSLRIWEAVDVWVAPAIHNRRYRQIKKKLDRSPGEDISLFIYPKEKEYIIVGLQIQF